MNLHFTPLTHLHFPLLLKWLEACHVKAGFEQIKQVKGVIWMVLEKISITSTNNAPHFIWGDNRDGWWLKQDGRFAVIFETMPPGTSEVKHFHRETEQFFYVLEGVLMMEQNSVLYNLNSHEAITVMPNVAHKVFNASNQDVKFLVVSCPNSHEDRVNLEA